MKLGQYTANLESLSESGALGATEDALKAEETAKDVAEGNVEIIEGVEEIDGLGTCIEDAFAADKQVEALLDAAEETMKDGGMSAREAKLLEVSHESIMSSIGMGHRTSGHTSNPIVSLESYGSFQTRQSATLATLESIKDTAKGLVDTIIKGLKAALSTVMNFISGLLRNRTLMARHIDNLIGRVGKIDTSKEKHKKDKIKAGAEALSVDGKASFASAEKVIDSAGKYVSAAESIAAKIKAELANGKEAGASLRKAVSGLGPATYGRKLVVEEKDDVVSVKFEEGKKASEIEAPTKEQMNQLLKSAKEVLAELRKFEGTQTKFRDGVNAIISRLSEVKDVVKSKLGSEESKAKAAAAAEVKKSARQARSILTKAGATLPGAAFTAIKAIADYVTAGVNNYGSGEAKADKK